MVEGKIECYAGALGSGKTAHAMEDIMEHLKRGGTVVTNVELFRDRLQLWMASHGLAMDHSRLLIVEDTRDFWKLVKRGDDKLTVLAVFDETHVEHGAREWQQTTREEMLFNTMVRKLSIRLIYVSQDI